ncbi:MAG TPA: RNA-binding protein [Puia sp.]|nr:RNA-binding protein [Puia sp.]
MNMYVSNLGFQVTEDELRSLFNRYGEVTSAKVITDRETGRSRGFGFVEMADKAGEAAMKELNGSHVDGRTMSVSIARARSDSGSSSYSRDRGHRW